MKDIFISFSSKDDVTAKKICDFIESNNISCFISLRDLIAGEEYAMQLLDNIDSAKAVLLVLSNASNNSPHVLREIEYAVGHNVPILVYPIEEVKLSKSMEYFLMTHQWINLDSNQNQKLLEGINHIFELSKYVKKDKKSSSPKRDDSSPAVVNEADNKDNNETADNLKKNNTLLFVLISIIAILLIFLCVFIYILIGTTKKVISTTDATVTEDYDTDTSSKSSTDKDDTDSSDTLVDDSSTSADDDSQDEIVELPYELGDTVYFGSYYNEPIKWRVIKINDDGTMMLITEEIICMKAFDAAEGGTYNEYQGKEYWSYANHVIDDEELQIIVRGNNDWSVSNIRTWLNSDKEYVDYKDQAPTKTAVGYNFYNTEAGFLYNFTDEEKDSIIATTNRTPVNFKNKNAKNGRITTTDSVYLLSSDELELLKTAGMHIYAKPSATCKEHDENIDSYNAFSREYKIDSYYWWLRDNLEDDAYEANIVVTEYEDGYTTVPASVGAYSYGVRPVVTVDGSSEVIKTEVK